MAVTVGYAQRLKYTNPDSDNEYQRRAVGDILLKSNGSTHESAASIGLAFCLILKIVINVTKK